MCMYMRVCIYESDPGLGSRAQGLGSRAQGLGSRAQGLGSRAQGLGLKSLKTKNRCTARPQPRAVS